MINTEVGIIQPEELNRKLWQMRLAIFLPSIIMFVLFVVLKITNWYNWKSGSGYVWGVFLGTIVSVLFNEIKPKYIYKYSMGARHIDCFLVNLLGKKVMSSIPINEILKVKFRKKGLWRKYDTIWVYATGNVEKYCFIEADMGSSFFEKIDVEKI